MTYVDRQHPATPDLTGPGKNFGQAPASLAHAAQKLQFRPLVDCRQRDAPMAVSLGSGGSNVSPFPQRKQPRSGQWRAPWQLNALSSSSKHNVQAPAPANFLTGRRRPGQLSLPRNQVTTISRPVPNGKYRPRSILPTVQQSLTTCCPQLDEHLLTPTSINSLEVHGATNTRRSLLDHVFKPLVEDSAEPGTTLGQVLTSVQAATKKLARFGAPSPSSTNPLLSANP